MSDKEARIRIGIDNAAGTKSDINGISSALGGVSAALSGVKKAAVEAGGAVAQLKPVNLKIATDDAERQRDQVTRLGIAMGVKAKGVEDLQTRLRAVGEKLKVSTEEVAAAANEYGSETYDFKGSVGAIEDLGRAGNNTGRSLQEMARIGVDLNKHLNVPSIGMASALRSFGDIAENVGTTGGLRSLLDSLVELGPVLEKFDTKTDGARDRLAAFVALAGKGLPHGQGTQAAGAALGWIASDALGLGRFLGRKSIIHGGKVDDPLEILEAIQKKVGSTRDREARVRILGKYTTFQGAENLIDLAQRHAEDAIYGKEQMDIGRAAGLKTGAYKLGALTPEQKAKIDARMEDYAGADEYAGSAAGKLKGARIERYNVETNDVGGTLLKGRDQYENSLSAKEKVAQDKALQVLGDTTGLGWVPDAATALRGANAGYDAVNAARMGKGPAEYDRAADLAAENNRLMQKQNQLLETMPERTGRAIAPDRNQASVNRRSAPPQ